MSAVTPNPRRSPTTTTPAPPQISSTTHKAVQRYCAWNALHSLKNKTLTGKKLQEEMFIRMHGNGSVESQVEMMMRGYKHYSAMQKRVDVYNTGLSSSSGWATVLDPLLHRATTNVIYGENLTADIIKQTALRKAGALSGKTLFNYANEEVKEAKKMSALMREAVKSGILAGPSDGRYQYASGKGDADLINFVLFRMKNWNDIYGPSGDDDPFNAEKTTDGQIQEYLDNVTIANVDEETLGMVPSNFLPKGFFLWWLRGNHPNNLPESVVNIFSLDHGAKTKEKGGGRKEIREKERKEKSAARDHGVGKGNEGRGLAYGAANQKELALVEQNERKLNQQEVATEIAVLSTLIQSKHRSLESDNSRLENMVKLNMEDEARELILSTKDKKKEIEMLEEKLQNVGQSHRNKDQSAHTNHFLQLGATATRMDANAGKKRKAADEIDLSKESDDDEEDDEEEDEDDVDEVAAD